MIIVKRENKLYNLQILSLEQWCSRIDALMETFVDINVQHVYKEINNVEDGLSKFAIDEAKGFLHFEEFVEDSLSHKGSIFYLYYK